MPPAPDAVRPHVVRQAPAGLSAHRQLLGGLCRLRRQRSSGRDHPGRRGQGPRGRAVERALGWARSLGRFERYEGLEREDIPLLPPTALREALVNAVVHRDYAISGSKVLLEVFHDRVGRHEARLRVNRARRLPKRPKPPTRGAACSLARRRELMDAWAAQSLVSPSLPLRSSAAIRGLYHLYTSYVNCILPRLADDDPSGCEAAQHQSVAPPSKCRVTIVVVNISPNDSRVGKPTASNSKCGPITDGIGGKWQNTSAR